MVVKTIPIQLDGSKPYGWDRFQSNVVSAVSGSLLLCELISCEENTFPLKITVLAIIKHLINKITQEPVKLLFFATDGVSQVCF